MSITDCPYYTTDYPTTCYNQGNSATSSSYSSWPIPGSNVTIDPSTKNPKAGMAYWASDNTAGCQFVELTNTWGMVCVADLQTGRSRYQASGGGLANGAQNAWMIFSPADLGAVAGGASENSIQPAITNLELPGLPYPSNLSPGSASTYMGTSSNSMTIGTGSHSFTASTGLPYVAGMVIDVASTAGATNHMQGQVTSYNSSTGAMTVNATSTGGSGTFSSWYVYGWYQGLPPFAPQVGGTPPFGASVMALGYDSTNQNLYVLSVWAASDWSPMVYVYHVNDSGSSDTTPPAAPSGLSVS